MIHAICHCRLFADPRLRVRGGQMYALAIARSREPDGKIQVLKLWTSEPAMRERLMQLRAGAAVVTSGKLVARAAVPAGGTEKLPIIDLCIESLEAESAASYPAPMRYQRTPGVVVQFPSAPKGAA